MKLTSMVTTIRRFGQRRRIERADVGAFHRDDFRAPAQPRMKLAGPDIDGIDAPRAAREQHVAEAAGGRTDIEADAAGDIDAEAIERGCELDAAARHPGEGGLRAQRRVDGDLIGWLAHRRLVGGDEAGGDRGLRLGAAFEQATLDEQAIGAQARGHGGFGA